MPEQLLEAFIAFTADSSGLSKVVTEAKANGEAAAKGIEKSFKGAGDGIKSAGNEASSLKKKLQELNREGGKSSALGMSAKLLAGGGAIAGVTLLGHVIQQTADKAQGINKAFREGKLGATDLAVEIGKAVPVIGSFVAAGQAIREMFTHEKEQLDDVLASTKRQNDFIKEKQELLEKIAAMNQRIRDQSADLRDATDVLVTAPKQKPVLEVEIEFRKRGESLNRFLKESFDAIDKESKERATKLGDDLRDMKTRRSHSDTDSDVAKGLDKDIAEAEKQIKSLNGNAENAKKAVKGTVAQNIKDLNEWHKVARDAARGVGDEMRTLEEQLAEVKSDEVGKLTMRLREMGATVPEINKAVTLLYKIKEATNLKETEKTFKELKARIQDLGLSPNDEAFNKFIRQGTHSMEQIKEYGKLLDQLTAKEKKVQVGEILKDLAKDAGEAGKTDLQKLIDQLTRLGATAGQLNDAKIAMEGIKAAADKLRATEIVKGLEDEIINVGKDRGQQLLDQLKALGATPDMLKRAKEMLDALKAVEHQSQLTEKGKSLKESLMTPLEKYQKEIAELGEMLGIKAIDKKTYQRGVQKAQEDLQKTAGAPKSIEQAFIDNLTRKAQAAGIINQEEQRKRKEAEREKAEAAKAQKEATKALKDSSNSTDGLKNSVDKLKERMDKGVPMGLA